MQYTPFSDPGVPDIRTRASRSTSRVALGFFVLMTVSQIAAFVAQLVLLRFSPATLRTTWFQWTVTIISLYVIAAPLAFLVLRTVPAEPPTRRRMSAKTFFIFLSMAFALLIVGSLVGQTVNNVIGRFFGEQESGITEAIENSDLWLSCLYSLVIAPIFEELFFRKLLVDRLRFLGDWAVVLLSGITFGLFHGNIEQFFYAALLGTLLALIYQKTGNILYTILVHSVINFFGGILPTVVDRLLPFNLADAATTEGLMDILRAHPAAFAARLLVAYLPYIFALIGVVFFCLYFRRMTRDMAPCPLPRGERAAPIVGNVGSILYLVVCVGSMILVIVSNALSGAAASIV